ncbi:type VII secretion protein EccB [Streptomyces daghestanicus]|uniref:Type VII secretion protein EccB n=1 Tax=Streptomyces daghestanicus TaxID=66885 RepID=A0ABQ3Q3Z7_9ACTN|nr:type VII secretion protein EccB [Streptomyces daghestanicus]GGU60021.1 type VII secretion protein EccB [Streptomyces daghestanicus]GHI31986.1 type VII secretion protein EccB [Streptomyces daghestanicus]
MQSRRDHVHAYQFATGRLAAALVTGEPATGEPPARRSVVGVVIGAVLAVLACAGFAVYGLIRPGGNTSWAKPNAIVVEKETGTRFLHLDGVLHPVANYSSALLGAAGSPAGTKVYTVSRNSLKDTPRGVEVGITGAPDSVPPAAALLTGEWSRCLTPGRGTGETVDFAPEEGRAAGRRRILVTDGDGTPYLLWDGRRYRIAGRSALVALELDGQDPLVAPAAWLDALPAGPTVAAASVPGRDKPGARIGGRPAEVGEVFTTAADGTGPAQYYVLRDDGLAPVSQTEYQLLAAGSGQGAGRQVTRADVAAAPGSEDRTLLHRLPDFLSGPVARPGEETVCLRQRTKGSEVRTMLAWEEPPAGDPVPVGTGLLLTPLPLPAAGAPATTYLVTELGVKYPLADRDALTALGYSAGQVRPVPPAVLGQLPTGPTLSRQGALVPVPVVPGPSPSPSASKDG